jgi:predicted ATPase
MREEDLFVDLVEPDEAAGGSFDVFLRRAGGPSIPVDELSSGQLELFLFFSALVLNDESDGIVFIDEPELHLDPQWHATILRTLMELQPRAQFIVATHSPAIYETAKSYERHFLVPEDDPRAGIWGQAVARP